MTKISFADWLREEMELRQWSQSDLARASGLTRQAISSYLNQKRLNPDVFAIVSLAHGLGYPPTMVFRVAGLLPPVNEYQVLDEEWGHVLSQLDKRDRDDLLAIARLKIEQAQKRKTYIQDQKGKYKPR